jgi:hypothetical protein
VAASSSEVDLMASPRAPVPHAAARRAGSPPAPPRDTTRDARDPRGHTT